MARRGRFGAPSGGANLAGLVQSLLKQKKSAEEQILLAKFKRGEATLDEVLAFYDSWASSAGYAVGSTEWQQLQESKINVKDENLVMRYNALTSEFASSQGANYQEVMDFLKGDALTSTDPNNLQSFKEALKSKTTDFIRYAGQRLSEGKITVADFKSQLNANFDTAFEPGSEEYKSAMYEALVTEFNAESDKWNNRISAGTAGALAGFNSFVAKFNNDMAVAGVSKDSALWTSVQATKANAASNVGSTVVNASATRAGTAESKLADIYGAILRNSDIVAPELTLADKAKGKTNYDISDITNNSYVFAEFLRKVDAGLIAFPADLVAMGITRENFNSEINRNVTVFTSAADAMYAVNKGETAKNYSDWGKMLSFNVGTRTGIDEFKDAANRYESEVAAAQASNDTVKLTSAFNEWQKYLGGKSSRYGTIPGDAELNPPGSGNLGADFMSALANSRRALNDDGTNPISTSDMTVEDYVGISAGFKPDGTPITYREAYASNSVVVSRQDLQRLVTGQAVERVSYNKDGSITHEIDSPSAFGPGGQVGGTGVFGKGGYITMLTYKDDGNGGIVPVVQQIPNVATINIPKGTSLTPWGYVYKTEGGETFYVGINGNVYNNKPFDIASTGDGNFAATGSTTEPTDPAVKLPGVPSVDVASIIRFAGGEKATDAQLRAAVKSVESKTSVVDPKTGKATPSAIATLIPGGIDAVNKTLGEITKMADDKEKMQISITLGRISERGDANSQTLVNGLKARLNAINNGQGNVPTEEGNSQGSLYTKYVAKNLSRYKEVQPGVFELANQPAAGIFAPMPYDPTSPDYNLPGRVDIRTDTEKMRTPSLQGKLAPQSIPDIAVGPFGQSFNFGGAMDNALRTIASTYPTVKNTPFNAQDREERRALVRQLPIATPPPVPDPIRRGGVNK